MKRKTIAAALAALTMLALPAQAQECAQGTADWSTPMVLLTDRQQRAEGVSYDVVGRFLWVETESAATVTFNGAEVATIEAGSVQSVPLVKGEVVDIAICVDSETPTPTDEPADDEPAKVEPTKGDDEATTIPLGFPAGVYPL